MPYGIKSKITTRQEDNVSMAADSFDGRTRRLADGNQIPVLGLGVWQVPNGRETLNAVLWALQLGYRHIDTAQAYGNEASVGEALRRSGIPREQVFITTKFQPSRPNAATEVEGSLRRLGVEYVDLYLVHWPSGGPTRAWLAMEQAHRLGYARSIGVSNFNVTELGEVMAGATVPPVVDQVNLSPFTYRRALLNEGRARNVEFEAYSPLGTGRTPAQVLLRWAIQHDLIVLPKSTHRPRIEENAQVFDFVLSPSEMAELDDLDRTGGTGMALEGKWWR